MNNTNSKNVLSKENLLTNAETKNTIFREAEVLKPIEQQIKVKLAYEWKNIFRCLCASDNEDMIDVKDFDIICMKYNVNLSSEELKKMRELYCGATDDNEDSPKMFNYRQLSYHLGLHKDSFNFMQTSILNSSRASRSIYKLKQSLVTNLASKVKEEENEHEYDIESKITSNSVR